MRRRRTRGFSLIELAVSTVVAVLLVGAAVMTTKIARESADSSVRAQTVGTRADRALWPMIRETRRGSLATLQKLDGTAFSDGETTTGFSIEPVTGWDGSLVTGPRFTYWLDLAAGETSGTLMRSEAGAADRQMATNVTAFSVTRVDQRLTVSIEVRSGPEDDRERTVAAGVEIAPRNP